jgi:hypothetical protein
MARTFRGGLRLQAAGDPGPVPLSTPNEVAGECAGVVVAAGNYVEVERLAGIECRAVADPAGPAAVACDILDEVDGFAGVPVVSEPVPVSVALALAGLCGCAVRVAHG